MKSNSQQQLENHLSNLEARWFAVYTSYKREKVVASELHRKGIKHFLPLLPVTRRYKRKIRHQELPLINHYIFVKIRKQDYVPVLETPEVRGFVKFAGNLIAIPEAEIDIMRRVIGQRVEVEAKPTKFNKGDEVEIVSGQLTGMRGVLLERRGNKTFVVELSTMGYALHMQIDPNLLRPCAPRGTNRSDNESTLSDTTSKTFKI